MNIPYDFNYCNTDVLNWFDFEKTIQLTADYIESLYILL